MLRIVKYNLGLINDWNSVIENCKNGTFLFFRDFMDYHSDKFIDFSVLIYRKEQPVAVMPICIDGATAYSHKGLTYGGLVLEKNQKLEHCLDYFNLILNFLKDNHFTTLIYKRIPNHYHLLPADEDEYVLFKLGAHLIRRDSALVIDKNYLLKLQSRRIRSVKKGKKIFSNIIIDDSLNPFWTEILIPNLKNKFGVNPVHSLEEINLLKKRFPRNIIQCNIYGESNEILAGTTLFITDSVVHAQYIAGSDKGRQSGALDLLFYHIIFEKFKDKRYFDFGISNENAGENVNLGLLQWKEGFGGRSISHDFYSISTEQTVLTNKIFT